MSWLGTDQTSELVQVNGEWLYINDRRLLYRSCTAPLLLLRHLNRIYQVLNTNYLQNIYYYQSTSVALICLEKEPLLYTQKSLIVYMPVLAKYWHTTRETFKTTVTSNHWHSVSSVA
jgi:hypothetical protein